MAKPTPVCVSKTDIKAVIFELEKAAEIYRAMNSLRASTRLYQINKIITKLKSKLS